MLVAAAVGIFFSSAPFGMGCGRLNADAGQNDVVGAVPAAFTPWINNGQTHSITQVGNTMVVGGTFTGGSPTGGSPVLLRVRICLRLMRRLG